jgi:ubiquinone/menaquinone biosynthesis C-methylase UbiE
VIVNGRKLTKREKPEAKEEIREEKARFWEVWHADAMARKVDAYWRGSDDEKRHRRNIAQLVKSQMETPEDVILEVGSGTGLVYKALGEEIGEQLKYIGVDIADPMLAIARRRYPMAVFKRGDAFALEFRSDEVDIACAFEVFGHMPDCSEPIAELVRVARRKAVFSVWIGLGPDVLGGRDHYEYPKAEVYRMIRRCASVARVTEHDIGHTRAFVVHKR